MTDRTTVATIGESIVIKGELSGDEDLVIDGQVEGRINLNQNVLTVGEHGKVKAEIVAKTVVIVGAVWGSIIATENVDIRDTSLVEGDIFTSRLAMAPGAYVRGRHRHAAVAKRQGPSRGGRRRGCSRSRAGRDRSGAFRSSWRSRWSASCCPVASMATISFFCIHLCPVVTFGGSNGRASHR